MLVPILLATSRLRAGRRRAALRAGRQEAGRRRRIAGALARLADGERKAEEKKENQADDRPCPDIRRVPGVSEVQNGQPLLRHKQALMEEAERLVQAGVLRDQEDIFTQVRGAQEVDARAMWRTGSFASARKPSSRIER